jgi:hypothetical protein
MNAELSATVIAGVGVVMLLIGLLGGYLMGCIVTRARWCDTPGDKMP